MIENHAVRARALSALGIALARAEQWEQAKAVWTETEAVIRLIGSSDMRAKVLRELAAQIAAVAEHEQLLHLIHHWWLLVTTREDALRFFPLVTELIPRNSELGLALYKAFTWVDTFLKG